MGRRSLFALILAGCFFGWNTGLIMAAPYFHLSGPTRVQRYYTYDFGVYLDTDGQTVTAAQAVINFDEQVLSDLAISTLSSRCSFWAPADPTAGFGSQGTPYFYNDNQVVLACGFVNPGYISSAAGGDLIAQIKLQPIVLTTQQSSLTFSNELLKYIGTNLNLDASQGLNLTVYESTAAANPSVTPLPSPAHSTQTITASDLNLIDISTGAGQLASLSGNMPLPLGTIAPLSLSMFNNIIPPPPPMTPRPTLTPRPTINPANRPPLGEVLSIRSLKELFIPGKTSADKTVVLINLLTTLAFLVILTILIWRLLLLSRTNRIKIKHMQHLVEGEMAVILGKSAGLTPDKQQSLKSHIDSIKEKLEKGQ
ncbi:hypothetical protein A2W24_01990 [Microgenomates group bacterium RBG_16_45_19]|nr:MAG: hypothetical protein A2W24_01990 [Microgenomates group bacterium RBG_16_45_19]